MPSKTSKPADLLEWNGVILFPINNAEKYIRTFAPSLVRTGDTLKWASEDGINELSVTPLNRRASDGLIVSEVVTLTHTSPAFANLSSEWISRINSLATISALVPGDETRPTQFVSKVGVFSTDQAAAEHVYAPLLCTEAAVIGWHAARLVRGQNQSDPAQSPLQQTNQNPPFDTADFEAIKAITDRNGYLGSLGDRYFCVELPWKEGAATHSLRHEHLRESLRAHSPDVSDEQLDRWAGATSLLQISIAEHPLYGKGVQTSLELPFSPDNPATLRIAHELNVWELSQADLPPHFGAWCVGLRSLYYASFMPTQYCVVPGLLMSLLVWMAARHVRARDWLNATPSRH